MILEKGFSTGCGAWFLASGGNVGEKTNRILNDCVNKMCVKKAHSEPSKALNSKSFWEHCPPPPPPPSPPTRDFPLDPTQCRFAPISYACTSCSFMANNWCFLNSSCEETLLNFSVLLTGIYSIWDLGGMANFFIWHSIPTATNCFGKKKNNNNNNLQHFLPL